MEKVRFRDGLSTVEKWFEANKGRYIGLDKWSNALTIAFDGQEALKVLDVDQEPQWVMIGLMAKAHAANPERVSLSAGGAVQEFSELDAGRVDVAVAIKDALERGQLKPSTAFTIFKSAHALLDQRGLVIASGMSEALSYGQAKALVGS